MVYNPYDDDPFGINDNNNNNTNQSHPLTPTINTINSSTTTTSNNTSSFKPRAFTTSPGSHQPQQYNSNYFNYTNQYSTNHNSNNTTNNNVSSSSSTTANPFTINTNVLNSPVITSTPTYQTTPRRSTIGFEDDFSNSATTPLDTNFTIESSDFLLSLGSSPSHRHTLSGASTNTVNTSPQISSNNSMTSPRNNMNNGGMNNSMKNMSGLNSHQNSFFIVGNVTGTNTSPLYTNVNNTPRQSISNSNEFNNEFKNISSNSNLVGNSSSIGNSMVENPNVSSIKLNEQQTAVKRRSRTMFESNNRNTNYSKDLLDFNPFSTNSNTTSNTTAATFNTSVSNTTAINQNTPSTATTTNNSKSVFDNNLLDLKNSLQEYDELSGESSPVNSRPKSMKFLKSSFFNDDSKNIRNSMNSNNTNDSISPNTNSSISNNFNSTTTTTNSTTNNASSTTTNTTANNSMLNREILHLGLDNKLTIPENILMICLSDSGIVKSYVSDQIEELCMMGIFCELILHKKITTRPLRDLFKGKFGLQVLDSKPIQVNNKRDQFIIELLNEVLNLINGINEKCLAKDVNQMTVKDYIKILCLGKKVGNVLIYKISNILTRIGKQLSERKIVDYKKTLFLFLSLPIKDKIERDRCLNELIVFLKMLRSELDLQEENLLSISGTLTYDTCTERMLKNRHDFVIYTLLGIFTMNNTDILSNDIIKNENDKKALKELSFSIFNIHNIHNNNGSMNGILKSKFNAEQQLMESDDDEQSEDNMLSINGGVGGGGANTFSSSNNLTLDKKANINLHHFPEGLNYYEEIALQLKRCIYGINKQ